ncbi:MAG: hypothetical protein IJ134_05550 [Bacilli bacterium]|nr:hypothetical protein [Bacilli bacterium]
MDYIKNTKNVECNNALKRVFLNIDIDKIIDFIDNTSCISDSRKEFYKKIIMIRYEILNSTYKKIIGE